MRIAINLATRPFTDLGPILKRLRIAMGVIALVTLGLAFGIHALHGKAEKARAHDHSLDGQIAQITRERQGYQALMRQPDNVQTLAQVERLNQLFDEKAFSWTLAMEDLETVLPGGVQVTTIEPSRDKQGHITLHLRVLGPRDRAIELVQNLEHSRRFVAPRIVGESSETSGGPGERMQPVSASSPVNFDVLAEYKPPTVGEHGRTRPATGEPQDEAESAGSAAGSVPSEYRQPYTGAMRPKAPVKPRTGGPNQ